LVSFDPDVLNRVYELSLEFGKNWRRPVLTIVQEVSPNWGIEKQKRISAYIEKTRSRVETYISERYVSDQSEMISALQRQGEDWMKAEFPWMNAETILHGINQAIYYAWHG